LVKGLIAGAIVLGFDPRARSWVTEARADGLKALPTLDGVLTTDSKALAAAADDWGHIVHRTPVAVLFPGSVEDIVKMVKFARANGLRVSGRGKGHTAFGQSQADAGLVIDMTTLNTIHSISDDAAHVDAGVVWRDLLIATTELGLTPPVLTNFTGLTVGGTLSVGGVSGTSYRHGAQVDNVLALQVVTGEGELVTCSRDQNADLFDAALAGLGLCAIIVRATIRLVPARENARTFRIFYPDIPSMLQDIRRLIKQHADEEEDDGGIRIHDVRGNGTPTLNGWVFYIDATSFYDAPADPSADALLAGLNYIPGSLQVIDQTYFAFCDSVFQLVQLLNQAGWGSLPHPWLDLFVPDSVADTFCSATVAAVNPADFVPPTLVLFYPFLRDRLSRPLLRVPDEEVFFLFDLLMATTPDAQAVAGALQQNRASYDQNVAAGGTHYTIAAVQLSHHDWKRHFQPEWGFLVSAKHAYDPGNVLGPGPGVF
jgi:FAD/FMN-containing dehydrogenase